MIGRGIATFCNLLAKASSLILSPRSFLYSDPMAFLFTDFPSAATVLQAGNSILELVTNAVAVALARVEGTLQTGVVKVATASPVNVLHGYHSH